MNITGFLRMTKLTFVKKRHESGDIYSFYFLPSTPLKHLAGQHGLFLLPGFKGARVFSLASAPEEEYVMISTHVRKGSKYKQRLKCLQSGDSVTLLGPALNFVYEKGASESIFLAQGIGITPFRSMLLHAVKTSLPVHTTLIHVDSSDHVFRTETEELATNARYALTQEEFIRLVTNTLKSEVTYYLSGSPPFIRETKRLLMKSGIKRRQIKSDNFFGY